MMDVTSVNACVCVNVIFVLCPYILHVGLKKGQKSHASVFIFAICFSINLLIWRPKEPSFKLCVSTAQPNDDK